MPNISISPAELSAAGIALHPAEAVAITHEVLGRARRGELAGIPSADVLRFTSSGDILVEGPVAAGGSVDLAARLLDTLLSRPAGPEVRIPGALKLVLARAQGTLDLPPYPSLESFASAIDRFAAPDASGVVASLYARHAAAATRVRLQPAAALTISDVRRARRATGLTLTEISIRSRIPVSLLRELEWGYFVNWPSGHYGRTQLVRYARAAGLDDEVVVEAVWPVLQDAIRTRQPAAAPIDAPAPHPPLVEMRLVKVEPAPMVAREQRRPRRRLLAALAIPALLAVAALPALFDGQPAAPDASLEPPSAVARTEAPPAAVEPRPAAADRPAARVPAPAPATAAPAATAAGPRPAALRSDAAFSPAFATTGSAMFYHADAGNRSALMRADTDASGTILKVTSIVDDSARNFHARPSPDGSRIAFDSDRDGERAVYVADADGRSVRRVTGAGFAAVPSWSPDGRRLAYVRAEPGRPQVWNLWLVDLSTGRSTRLTSHRVGQPWGAAWFPDGERIAYSHEDRLIVRTVDGRKEQAYPSPRKGRLLRTPAVSPDGRKVVFQLYRDGAWMLDLKDASMRRILSDPTAEEFTWAPDGRRVAYHSRKTGDWNVWMMAPR